MPRETQFARDIKKAVGSPKIMFVLGGPATGKGTQCEKLVEEFGYQHISTGDLLRIEMARGSKEGEEIKKIVAEGGLVSNQMIIQLLVKAIMEKPAKNYLIDGFPRTVEQAVQFEQNVLEAHQVLYFDAPKEVMLERCLKRAETSGRVDDKADVLEKRVQNFLDQSYPVVQYYEQFGKVSRIPATGSISEISAMTKEAVLPQMMFVLGQKGSGKSSIAGAMAARSNMKHISFSKWVADNGLEEEDDESVCLQLIQALAVEQKPRVVIESFPQNVFQAKFFLRNCTCPSNVFFLQCPIDVSQSRVSALGDTHESYISPVELSKQIKAFCDSTADLMPFLKEKTNFTEVNTEGTFEKTMETINTSCEPCVIHVRPGAKNDLLRKEITTKLCNEHDFINLDVPALIKEEMNRKTSVGLDMYAQDAKGTDLSPKLIVKMLQQIIYSGIPSHQKFILSNFPENIEQVQEFETCCAKIQTVIYSTGDDPIVEIAGNNLEKHNIDSQFQKEFRLQTMNCWDFSIFQEKLGNKVEYGVLLGPTNSGKTTLAQVMKTKMDYEIIDVKAVQDNVREGLKGEDGEPFEGDIPEASIEKAVSEVINAGQSCHPKKKFLFDGVIHKNPEDFTNFLDTFGMPTFVLKLSASDKYLKERFCKKSEVDEFPEDALDTFKEQLDTDAKVKTVFDGAYLAYPGRCSMMELNTDNSLETTSKQLVTLFSPQVILVNHEKRLSIDTECANLAIKYNMIYLSACQVIAQHVQGKTKWGELLTAGKRKNCIKFEGGVDDQFNESEFAPSLYDQKLVLDLIRTTIQDKRTNQKYVLLEGFCNSSKLADDEDKLEVRQMDELFQIEKHIGSVKAIVGLQFIADNLAEEQHDLIQFSQEEIDAHKPKAAPAEGEEPPPEVEGGAPPKWNPTEFSWSITNKKPKNLSQLFVRCKGQSAKHLVKKSEDYSANEREAVSKSLDDLVCKAFSETPYLVAQVIFTQ